jgi:hypothetical protein
LRYAPDFADVHSSAYDHPVINTQAQGGYATVSNLEQSVATIEQSAFRNARFWH